MTKSNMVRAFSVTALSLVMAVVAGAGRVHYVLTRDAQLEAQRIAVDLQKSPLVAGVREQWIVDHFASGVLSQPVAIEVPDIFTAFERKIVGPTLRRVEIAQFGREACVDVTEHNRIAAASAHILCALHGPLVKPAREIRGRRFEQLLISAGFGARS